jgi:hypothetical protein
MSRLASGMKARNEPNINPATTAATVRVRWRRIDSGMSGEAARRSTASKQPGLTGRSP